MFIVMPCYEGESLQVKIERGPMKLDESIEIATQVASGLARAHEKEVIHRDIKPGNIFITKDGAKILDFGLAKLAAQTRLTKTGTTVGTAMYMSPEQARGQETDQRSDIWSLGVVLYEMLTGRPPFVGEHEAAVLYQIMNEEPRSITGMRVGVPAELERIVSKCIAKSREERYQHAGDIVADLRHLASVLSSPMAKRPEGIKKGVTRRPIHWRPWIVAVVVVLAVAVGVVSRYRAPSTAPPVSGRKMLAVLPFVNLGSPDDEYFAAGITEEITARLATMKELGVISRTSAVHYAGTGKTIKEIGSELGVHYILEGTVRWARAPGGTSRVRITPQLIRVSDDTYLWSEPYDRVIQDIFDIQSDIAQNVVEHLGVTLLDSWQRRAEAPPTDNLDAYQAYLQGRYYAGQPHFASENWKKAIENYQRAVDLDPRFALAFAHLSEAHARLYYFHYDMSEDRRNSARAAVDKALEIEPNAPEVHLALGYFHLFVEKNTEQAFKEFEIAGRDYPDNAEVLEAKGDGFRQEGRWTDALDHYERACRLDPRNAAVHETLAEAYWWSRRYSEALDAANKAIALAPDQMWPHLDKAFSYWSWKGKDGLKDARAALGELGPGQDPDWVVWSWFFQAAFERKYGEALGYLTAFPNDWIRIKIGACPKSLLFAQVHEQMGESERSRSEYENAKDLLEREIRTHPEDPRYHSSLGVAYASLGRNADAIREGLRAVDLLPVSKDAVYGIPYVIDLALIYTIVGDEDPALSEIERLLSQPSWISPAWLEVDFRWDRLRDNPKFEQLIEKYSRMES
jgi:TolB-like protein/Flp pilus assembly protein TadD